MGRQEDDSKPPESESDISPIARPEDESWQDLLRQKHKEYTEWLDKKYAHKHPLLRDTSQRGYAALIIDQVLENESVDIINLSLKLGEEQGFLFDLENFEKACRVINEYTTNKKFLLEHLKQ